MKLIDVDEAAELTIRCRKNRSFLLSINLSRDLTGKQFKLHVDTTPPLTFESGSGLTVEGQSIVLDKTPQQMNLPTGIYAYDLVELSGQQADNIFYGPFIIQPSITPIP